MNITTTPPLYTADTMKMWYESWISAVVAVAGTLFNTLSLTYFIHHDNQLLGSKLLILLNLFDLCVCTASTATVFLELYQVGDLLKYKQTHDLTSPISYHSEIALFIHYTYRNWY